MDFLLPDLAVADYTRLDLKRLHAKGIRLLFCDVDNTLSRLHETRCPDEAFAFLMQVKKAGIEPVLMTNNTRKHLEEVFGGHPVSQICTFACKPFPFAIRRLLKENRIRPQQAAILGDQLFTDMLAGKLAGITTILSLPLDKQERGDTKIMRLLEKPVYDAWEKRGKLKRGNNDVRIL